ncbi:MAG TPA: HU family DNA-binding protein [Gammaproteobacteria bacterium]|nr:HU family DNA-binding protein [Gammaproteobacteria bacterium]
MNKSELIQAIAEQTSLSKADAKNALNATLTSIQNTLARGESVVLTGFGNFEVRQRAARTGRNPKTGEAVAIKASKAPAFKAGKVLKEAVNT